MKEVRKVLTKALVSEFYKANAGFFLVSIGLIFGFLKTPQQIDIATALAFSPVYYLAPLAIWMLYGLKTLSFCKNLLHTDAYRFLSYIDLLSYPQRLQLIFYIQALLLAPVLGYGLFLTVIALQLHQWTSVAWCLLGNGLVLAVTAHWLHQILISPTDPNRVSKARYWFNLLPKTRSMLFIHHLLNRQTILLLGTKLISLVVLIGFIMIYDMEGTDNRFISLGLLLSAGINAIFSFRLRDYEQETLGIFNNLPITTNSWFFTSLLTFSWLCLPELLILYTNSLSTVSPVFLLKNSLLPVSLLTFFYSICYARPVNMEEYIKYPFFTTATLFFVILGHVDSLWISLALLLFSFLLYKSARSSFDGSKVTT